MDLGIKTMTLKFDDNQLGHLAPIQGDTKSRGFVIEMVSADGEIVPADSIHECRLYGVNSNYPDKTFYTKAEVVDGKYKVYLSTDMVSKAGTLKMQIALYKGSEELIQSEVKEVEVTESMANGGSIGKDLVVDFTKLEEALERVDTQEKAYTDSLKKQEAIRVDVENKQKQVSTDTTAVEKIRTDMEGVMDAEADRVEAEKKRVSQEKDRVSAEKDRQSQENSRVEAEKDRQNFETQRAKAETARVEAENARADAEKDRQDQENTRIEAEDKRKSAEDSRVSAEKKRQSQEDTRQNQETQRVEAEEKRKTTFEGWNLTMQGVIPNATDTTAGVVKVAGLGNEEAPYLVYSAGVIGESFKDFEKEIGKKAGESHTHSIKDVDNLQTELGGKAEKEHVHKCSDIEVYTGNSAYEHYYELNLESIIENIVSDIYENKDNLDKKINFIGQIPAKNMQLIEKGGSTADIPNTTLFFELE